MAASSTLTQQPPTKATPCNRLFIAACRAFDFAYDTVAGNHGELTKALLEGLDCSHRDEVTAAHLINTIQEKLTATTQEPLVFSSGGKISLTFNREYPKHLAPPGTKMSVQRLGLF
ncbi:MAG: hypothetical protein ABL933_10190 [Methyloglobulus sp.]|nr:hypothetical protein [Methyloglobulus sp.]